MQWIEAEDWSRGRNIIEGIPFASPIPEAIETTLTPTLDSGTWGVDGALIDTQTAWFDVTPDMWSIRGLTDPTSLTQAAPARGHAADGAPFSEYWNWNSDHLTYVEWTTLPLSQRSNKWVLADDGFFYYTSVIRPETDTLPLMTGVSAATGFDPLRSAFYYAIDIQMEVVTQDDIGAMKDGLVPSSGTDGVPLRAASAQGKAILDAINWEFAPAIFGLIVNGSENLEITVMQGTPVTLEVDAGGHPDLTYLWQTINSPWNDAPGTNDTDTYVVDTTTPGTYEFRVLVSNSGSTPVEDDGHTTASDTITIIVSTIESVTPTIIRHGDVDFFRIARYGNYDLLVTRFVYDRVPTDFGGTSSLFNPTGQGNYWLRQTGSDTVSNIMQDMDYWYNAVNLGDLKVRAVQADFSGDNSNANIAQRNFGIEGPVGLTVASITGTTTNNAAAAAINIPWMQDPDNWPQALSMPSGRTGASAATQTDGTGIVAFPLSGKEILSYFSNIGTDIITSETILAPRAYQIGADHNMAITATRNWWSRSRGSADTGAGYTVGGTGTGHITGSWGALNSNGNWAPAGNAAVTNTATGLRPAIWVERKSELPDVPVINNLFANNVLFAGAPAGIPLGATSPSLRVAVEGVAAEELTYQWQSSSSATGPWTNATGAGNDTFVFTGASTESVSTTYYRALVSSNETGPVEGQSHTVVSDTIPVVIYGPPEGDSAVHGAFISTSSDGNVGTTTSVSLPWNSVEAPRLFINNPTIPPYGSLLFQWQYSIDGTTWTNVTGIGATTNTYTGGLPIAPGVTYYVRCLVSNDSNTPGANGDRNTWASGTATVIYGADPNPNPNPVLHTPVGTIPERTNIPNTNEASPFHRVIFDGVPFWRIASATNGGTTYYLIVTQHTYARGTQFNPTWDDGNFWLSAASPSTRSSIMVGMDAWYNAQGPQLKAAAVFPAFSGIDVPGTAPNGIHQTDPTQSAFGTEGTYPMTNQATWLVGNNWFTANDNRYINGQSRPSATLVGTFSANTQPLTGGGIVAFPLSGTEILAYFPDTQGTTNATRVPVITSDQRLGRIALDSGGSAQGWWSRTRGGVVPNNDTGRVDASGNTSFGFGRLQPSGNWTTPNAQRTVYSTDFTLRPALWVVMP